MAECSEIEESVSPEKYVLLKKMFKDGEVRKSDIRKKLGVPETTADSMIKNITFELPIWEPRFGVYKVLTEEDFEKYK